MSPRTKRVSGAVIILAGTAAMLVGTLRASAAPVGWLALGIALFVAVCLFVSSAGTEKKRRGRT